MLVASLRPPGWVVGFGFTEAGTPTRPHRLCWGRVCYGMQRCSSLLSRVLLLSQVSLLRDTLSALHSSEEIQRFTCSG